MFGSIPSPYDIDKVEALSRFHPIRCLLLHGDETARRERLRLRGVWTEAGIECAVAAAEEIYAHAAYAKLPIIDTTEMTVAEAAKRIEQWVLSGIGKE